MRPLAAPAWQLGHRKMLRILMRIAHIAHISGQLDRGTLLMCVEVWRCNTVAHQRALLLYEVYMEAAALQSEAVMKLRRSTIWLQKARSIRGSLCQFVVNWRRHVETKGRDSAETANRSHSPPRKLRRDSPSLFVRQETAASTLQAGVAGLHERWKHAVAEEEDARWQGAIQGHHMGQHTQNKRTKEHESACRIHAGVLGWHERQLGKRRSAASMVTAGISGHVVRKRHVDMEDAASRIQANVVSSETRHQMGRRTAAATVVQAIASGRQGRLIAQNQEQADAAASQLIGGLKGKGVRNHVRCMLKSRDASASIIQAGINMHVERGRHKRGEAVLVVQLQAGVRGREIRRRDVKRAAAARVVQGTLQAFRERQEAYHLRWKDFEQQDDAALQLQALVIGHILRRRSGELIAHSDKQALEAAKRIQAAIIGKESRIDVNSKRRIVACQEIRRNAIRLKMQRDRRNKLDARVSTRTATEAKFKAAEQIANSKNTVEDNLLETEAARQIQKGICGYQARNHVKEKRGKHCKDSGGSIQEATQDKQMCSPQRQLFANQSVDVAAEVAAQASSNDLGGSLLSHPEDILSTGSRGFQYRKQSLTEQNASLQMVEAAQRIYGALTGLHVRFAVDIMLIRAEEGSKLPPDHFDAAAKARWATARDAKMHLRIELCRCHQRARLRKLLPNGDHVLCQRL